MFGLMSKKRHDALMAIAGRQIVMLQDRTAEQRTEIASLYGANVKLADENDDLRAFKAKVMKGLIAANAAKAAKKAKKVAAK